MPKRIQRKRTKGWRMPEGAISVTRPGRWGNPYKVGSRIGNVPAIIVHKAGMSHLPAETVITPQIAVDLFRAYIDRHQYLVISARLILAGYDLAVHLTSHAMLMCG